MKLSTWRGERSGIGMSDTGSPFHRLVGVGSLLFVLAVQGCSLDGLGASVDDPSALTEHGLSREDLLAAAQAEEGLMVECMAAKGFSYIAVPAEEIVVFTEDMPGYGMTESLLAVLRGTEESKFDPNLEQLEQERRDAFIEARINCRDESSSAMARRAESPAASAAKRRLEAEWDRFRGSDSYIEAVRGWSRCMTDNGYDFGDMNDAQQHIIDQLTELGTVDEVRSVDVETVTNIQAEEIAIHEVDETCQTLHVDPVELEFKVDLFSRLSDDVTVVRNATRGVDD